MMDSILNLLNFVNFSFLSPLILNISNHLVTMELFCKFLQGKIL